MYLEFADKLDAKSILLPEVMDELFEIESEYERTLKYQELEVIADRFKLKGQFQKLYRAKIRDYKKSCVPVVTKNTSCNLTQFTHLGENQYLCGDWIADDSGVKIHTEKGFIKVSPHPIYPTKILHNIETGQYKVEIEFLVRNKVRRAQVNREVIASHSKILQLANEGVQVNANTAKWLVSYLTDLESLNSDIVQEKNSTSRLGWVTDIDENGNKTRKFLPYDSEVEFDNELNTKALFDSIKTCGLRERWFDLVREIRSKKQTEVLINLAAGFSSVLVEPCGALPFIVSLWGGTGIGKTVVLMLVTSIWADPSEGVYMTDAKATNTAMEIRLNILNSLPMTLDDMAQIKNQYDEDFSQLIYRWCAGKGRDRSNQSLGLNKLTSWRNCTITNGERSLVDETTQGGAVNRVIDIESDGSPLFSGEYGNYVANSLRRNYGFAGREFVTLIEDLGDKYILELTGKYFEQIKTIATELGSEKEDKQIMPMALILAADELIEQYLFKDGARLDIRKCVNYLKNKGEVNEHKRAYDYIRDFCIANKGHFASTEDDDGINNIECYGSWLDDGKVAIIGSIFEREMKKASFQARAFLSWAEREGLIEVGEDGRKKKNVKVQKTATRCVVLVIDSDFSDTEDYPKANDGFEDVIQEELPFD